MLFHLFLILSFNGLTFAQDAIRSTNISNFHFVISSICNADKECLDNQINLVSKCPAKNIRCEESAISIEKNILDTCKNDLQCTKTKSAKISECLNNESCVQNYKSGSFQNLNELVLNVPSKSLIPNSDKQQSINKYHSLVFSNCLFNNECVASKFSMMAKCSKDSDEKCSSDIYKSEVKIKRECNEGKSGDSQKCYMTKNEEQLNCSKANNCKGANEVKEIAQDESKLSGTTSQVQSGASGEAIPALENKKVQPQDSSSSNYLLAGIMKYFEKMRVSDQAGISKHLIDGQARLKKINEKYAEDVNEINNKWK